jgi:hypothetical protein
MLSVSVWCGLMYNYLSGKFLFSDETSMHELYLLQQIKYLHLYVILELDDDSSHCRLVFMSI